jgi:D-alanyl-D-alanine carboxypeptidase (penicillin-binding protein 5/6)
VVLIDEKTGKVLFEKNAHYPAFPASTTKIATSIYSLYLLKDKPLDTLLEVHPEALLSATKAFKKKNNYQVKPYLLEPDGISYGLKAKEKLTLESLLHGALLASGNDAANVLAHHLGNGDIVQFITGLNHYIKGTIGCTKTTFKNPSGLHHPEHVTTAYDLALMMRFAVNNPIFKDIVKAKEYIRKKTSKTDQATFRSSNYLIREGEFFYPYATGGKTGYTEDAGYCLVATANNKKRSLIAVILGCKKRSERFLDAIEIFNQAFNEPLFKRKVYHAADASFKITHQKCSTPIELIIKDDLYVEYYPSLNPEIVIKTFTHPLDPPFKANTQLGFLEIYLDNELVTKAPLFTKKDYSLKWHLTVIAFMKNYAWALIGSVGLLGIFSLVAFKKFKQRRRLVKVKPLRP